MAGSDVKRFVFVLGAGSSVDFGFPMGSELTGLISSALDFRQQDYGHIYGGNDTMRAALSSGVKDCPNWYSASKLISSAMPLAPSIDNFVNVHRHDVGIAYCAKVAIAQCILDAERRSNVFVNPSNAYNTINFARNIKAWHTLFFRIVTMYSTIDDLQDRLREIAVVTFNYDRSFEHFLFYAVKTYYKVSNEVAAKVVNQLEVYHPYGKVGKLPFLESGETIPYGEAVPGRRLLDISQQIRTFTEGSDPSSSDIIKIRSTVLNARALVFLGFAYHPLNMDLLFGTEQQSKLINYERKVFGTAFGSSKSDTQMISWDIGIRYGCDRDAIELRNDLKCDELFNEYSRTLSLN
ncbi:hypothetical protein [uncultured Massilia sp.]|uniref:hypothetical protein n=1 Tax=uncultured Massilia sp. TaxID=169973 RepID=UPI00258E7E76|nr:hypothetical protein [uncultured Massilia sp.]